MSSNQSTIDDEDGHSTDWIELYYGGPGEISLAGFGLSDDKENLQKWTFPDYVMEGNEYLLVHASDKNRNLPPLNWETVIDVGDLWKYIVPTSEPSSAWRNSGYDDSAWNEGPSGIGFGDDDDNTVISESISVFSRRTFSVSDPSQVQDIILHLDYDDGFVAYLNGVEIARDAMVSTGIPIYNENAGINKESVLIHGGIPASFKVSPSLLSPGTNVLAIQVHNAKSSPDLTMIPILSFGYIDPIAGNISEHIEIIPNKMHTNFKVSSEGETIYLSDNDGVILDSLYSDNLSPDVSIGRYPDGATEIRYFLAATPGNDNITQAFPEIASEVNFSHQGGLHSGTVQLSMTSDKPDDVIYYTLDGSIPTISSAVYNAPININENTVVKATVIKPNVIQGKINSQTYLFSIDHDIPVVSIIVDPDEMFDSFSGIYAVGPNAEEEIPHFGANYWEEKFIEGHIELFEKDGSLAFSQNVGVKIHGNWTRVFDQKSLAIHTNSEFGGGPIEYKIFEEKDIDEFSSIILRNSGSDWNNVMFRDAVLGSIFHESLDKQAYKPSVVYINGEYWGIMNIREKTNEDFVANNNNVDPDNIDIVKTYGLLSHGDLDAYNLFTDYVAANNLADPNKYEKVKALMDVQNFCFYHTGEIFIHNHDWPGNNIKFWKEKGVEGKWRWILYDTDFGFGMQDPVNYTSNTIDLALEPNGAIHPNPPWSTLLFRKLVASNEFVNQYVNTFADQLNSNFLPENVKAKILEGKLKIENEIEHHMDRWGGDYANWESRVNAMLTYADERPAYVKSHLKSQFGISGEYDLNLQISHNSHGKIQVNTLVPDIYPWTGEYFNEIPITLTAVANQGFEFIGWEGDQNSTDKSITLSPSVATTMRAVFAASSTADTDIIINEINYNSSDDFDANDWIELYNNDVGTVDISNWVLKDSDDTHEFVFPEGTSIDEDAFLVITRNMVSFESVHDGVVSIGDISFGLGSDEDCVRLFDDTGALIDSVCYTGENPWPAAANGLGATLSLIDPGLDNVLPENWFAEGNNGSPGQPNVQDLDETEGIVINEINYNSSPDFDADDWVELYNVSEDPIDLSLWIIKDNDETNEYVIPEFTILDDGDYLVITRDNDSFNIIHPGISSIGDLGFGLSSAGDCVKLFNRNGVLVDEVCFESSSPWPEDANGTGATLALTDPLSDNALASNWFALTSNGTPGAENLTEISELKNVVINEINYNSSPTSDSEDWVELFNLEGEIVDLSNWTITNSNESNEFVIPSGTELPTDGYLVIARDMSKFSTIFSGITPIGDLNFDIASGGDCIKIFNAAGTLVDEVCFENDSPWPTSPNGMGPTLTLKEPGLNNSLPQNWYLQGGIPTPGAPNSEFILDTDKIVINEINYNSPEEANADDWIELFNADDELLDLSNWVIRDEDDINEYIIPDGTTLAAGSYLVITRNNAAFESIHPSVPSIGNFPFGLNSAGDCIRLFNSDDILVDNVCYDNNDPWPAAANGFGPSLGLNDPLNDNADPENWYASAEYGSPGAPNEQENSSVEGGIVINEINYNASSDNDSDDWVEIINTSNEQIDLGLWILKDNDDTHEFIFPIGTTIQPDELMVISRNIDQFATVFPSVTALGNMSFGLGSDGDCVRIFNSSGLIIDEVCYENTTPWPLEANGLGATLALRDPESDNSLPQNWYALANNGNPGQSNFNPISGLDISDTKYKWKVYPSPASTTVNFEFNLEKKSDVKILLQDLNGRIIKSLFDKTDYIPGSHKMTWQISSLLDAGIYLIRFQTAEYQSTIRLIIN